MGTLSLAWRIVRLLRSGLRSLIHLYYRVYFALNGIPWGEGWYFSGRPIVRVVRSSNVRAGCRLKLLSRTAALGINHPVVLATLAPGSFIHIGDDVGISGATICARMGITIGNRVLIGANVSIIDNDMHPLESEGRRYRQDGIQAAPIVIEDDTFIGAEAIILKGVTVGRGSVVGAGSVVVSDVPPYSIVAGNPARVIKSLR